MSILTLDTSLLAPTVDTADLASVETPLRAAHQSLLDNTCLGNDFLGWRDWPVADHQDLLAAIRQAADAIRAQSQALVVIGIGGSHLAGQAGIEFLSGLHSNELSKDCQIYFVGHDLSAREWANIADLLKDKDFSINVISKSGTTLEPALAFAYFRRLLEEKYGQEAANKRIYATTDAHSGLLHDQAVAHGWTRFVVPDNIGGRYSGLTSVGLLPWAVAGIDLSAVLQGAALAYQELLHTFDFTSPVWQYAASRLLLLRAGKVLELFTTYEPSLNLLGSWWQQLFGESEGKTDQVIFPATIHYTRDLHSLGQFVQQGSKNLFETTLCLRQNPHDLSISIPTDTQAALSFLDGKSIDFVQRQAQLATVQAHHDGGVAQLVFTLECADERSLGYTLYFFELACSLSALLLGVNPFDQPGVQAYKAEMMRRLLGENL